MKRWEKLLIVCILILAIGGIAFGVTNQKRIAQLAVTKEIYEKVVGTSEPGSSEKIYDEYGQLTEEAEKKFLEKTEEGECDVVLPAKVESPRSIPKIQQVKWQKYELKSPKELINFYHPIVKDNVAKRDYQIQYDKENSIKNPYGLSIDSSSSGITKFYYDMAGETPWNLTEEMAVEKAKKVVRAVNELYNLQLNEEDTEAWEIDQRIIGTRECAYRYENDVKENCYAIGVGQTVQGRLVFYDNRKDALEDEPVQMELALGETGWKMISIFGGRMYQTAKGKFSGLITAKKAIKIIKTLLEMKTDFYGTRMYQIKEAKLGYLDDEEQGIVPVWRFVGKMDGKIQNIEGEVVIDARSGDMIYNTVGI